MSSRPPSSVKKGVSFTTTLEDLDNMEKIKEEFSNAETVTESTSSKWPKVNFDGTFAKFAKKSEPEIVQNTKKSRIDATKTAQVALPANPTAYPSLSHRLNATQHTASAPLPHTPNMPTPRMGFNVNNMNSNMRRKNAMDVNLSRNQLAMSLAPPTRMEIYNGALHEQHQDRRILAGESASQPDNPMHPHHHLLQHADSSDELSVASTVFAEMDMEEVLDYLLASRDPATKHAPFVHVTPRYNVEKVRRENFYDLVVLEKPGNPQSELVWIPRYKKTAQLQQLALDPLQVMQLSLHGLLVGHEGENNGELISLRDFMLQRSQVEFLRTGRFFGCFPELKCFTAWRNYSRGRVVSRMRRKLLRETFFSDNELVTCVVHTNNMVHELSTDLNLFVFHGSGGICVTDYVALQIRRTAEISDTIVQKIHDLTADMQVQSELFAQSSKLSDMTQDVIAHHPFRHLFSGPAEDVHPDLYTLRSLVRIKADFKAKLKRAFVSAQLKIDTAVAGLLGRFWRQFKQFVLGVRTLTRTKARRDDHYWEVDNSLFDHTGSLLHTVLEEFNTVHLFPPAPPTEPRDSAEEVERSIPAATTNTTAINHDDTDEVPPENDDNVEKLATNFGYVRSVRAYNEHGIRIPPQWEEGGSHLCLDVNLCVDKRPLELSDFMTLASIETLKVVIFPLKSALNDELHTLVGALGDLLTAVPNLRKHPLIYDSTLW